MSKKIIAIVTTITCAVWMMGPGMAQALTADELQAQINTLLAQLSTLQTQLTQLQGGTTTTAPAVCSGITFSRTLTQGMSGNDVKCMQALLNQSTDTQVAASGAGSPGNETTYFGALTKAAVVKFQQKYAADILTPLGLTAGTGVVGTKTIAKLNALLQVTPPPGTVCGNGVCETGETSANCAADCPVTPVPTTATISLAADSPAASAVAKGAQDYTMLKVKFTAGSTAYTVSKVVVARGGVSADADISSISLYDGTTRLGSIQALNTTTHKATFSGLSWQIPASSTKYLTVKASIACVTTTTACDTAATAGNQIQLGIAASDDITSTVALGGTFPIWGNAKTVAGVSVGTLDVDVQTTPAANTNMLSGSTDQDIASWKFAATNENFNVTSIKITQVGSAANTDISNLKLKYAGSQIGSTVASLASDNSVTFDLSSSPLVINDGTSKIIHAYTDVASGIWTSRTVIFEITQYTDVVAYGTNSSGQATATCSVSATGCSGNTSGSAFAKQTGKTMTVGQGALSVAADASQNPSIQSYVKGTSNRLILALRFSTGSTEGARVTQIKLTKGAATASTDISNVTLWDGTTQIAGPASIIGSYVTFGTDTTGWDTTGLFDLNASQNKTLLVRADIPNGASTSDTAQLKLDETDSTNHYTTNIKGDGLSSQYDLPHVSISSGGITGSAHTIAASGSLAVSLSSTSPVAQAYVKGATGKEFAKINLTAGSGEDISVSAITFSAYDQSSGLDSGYLTNVKVMNGATQYGNTIANGSSSMSFSSNLTVPASSTVVLSVIADIPISTGATSAHIDVAASTDVVATGVSSSASITGSKLTGSATGKTMTIGTGTLTVAAASTPGDQTVIINATDTPYVGLTFTAGTAEDIRVNYVKLTRSSSGTGLDTDISNVALYDGTTRLTTKMALSSGTVTFSASEFLNSLGIDIAKGTQKTITVKADAPSTAANGDINALGIATTTGSTPDVLASGLASGVTFTVADSNLIFTASPTNCTKINYTCTTTSEYEVTLSDTGTLTSAVASDTPTTTIISVGPEGTIIPDVAFTKFRLTASLEDIELTSVKATLASGSAAAFNAVKLYQGTTLLGTQQIVGTTTTFNFPVGSRPLIPKGASGTQYFTVKGDMKGIATVQGYGSVTGDNPELDLAAATISGQGASSGATINPSTNITGNAMYLRMAVPTIAASTLPTSTLSAGTKTLFKWTHTSSATGETSWKKIQFDISGNLTVTASKVIGYESTTTGIDGIAIQNTSGTIVINGLKVYNDTTNTELNNGTYVVSYENSTTGCVVTVVDGTATNNTEEIISAGGTRIYRLEGSVLYGGATGDAILTKISNKGTNITNNYTTVAAAAGSLVWSDRSGPDAGDLLGPYLTHGYQTTDWTNDYKVTGIPTTTLTLSR